MGYKENTKAYQNQTLEYLLGVSVELKSSETIAALSDSPDIIAEIIIDGKPVTFQIDSGTSTNVLPARYVRGESLLTTITLKMWTQSVITSLGKCRMKLRNPVNQKKYSVEFIVVTENLMPLSGKTAAEQMNLMVVFYYNMKPVHKLRTVSSIVIQYEDVFNGELGTIPGTVHFTVDPTVKPVVSPAR